MATAIADAFTGVNAGSNTISQFAVHADQLNLRETSQAGANGNVDAFRVNHNSSLTAIGSVTVAGAVGGEGIIAS